MKITIENNGTVASYLIDSIGFVFYEFLYIQCYLKGLHEHYINAKQLVDFNANGVHLIYLLTLTQPFIL